MAVGAMLLVLTVGLFDDSASANNPGPTAQRATAEISSDPPMVTEGDRAKTLVAIVDRRFRGDRPTPTVRVASPDGSAVREGTDHKTHTRWGPPLDRNRQFRTEGPAATTYKWPPTGRRHQRRHTNDLLPTQGTSANRRNLPGPALRRHPVE
jgi:hypothetical protein